MKYVNNVVVYSATRLFDGDSASSARMTNYAKALSQNCKVYFFTFADRNINSNSIKEVGNNLYTVGSASRRINRFIALAFYPYRIIKFLKDMHDFSLTLNGESVFLLYPSMTILIDVFSILYLKKVKNKKVFLEVNEVRKFDPMFFSDLKLGFIKSLKINFLKKKYILNEKLSKYFEGLICISTNIEKYYSRYNKNTIRIPILCDVYNQNVEIIKSYDTQTKFLIGFTGWISIRKENLDLFFESLVSFKKWFDNFELHLYGPINELNLKELNQLTETYNLRENIFHKGEVSQKDLPLILKEFHLLVLPRGFNLQNHYGFSTKLSEYLVSGVPTLLTKVSDNALYMEDNVNGFIVTPDSKTEMANKLKFIVKNYNELVPQIIENANKTVKKHFIYSNYSSLLMEFLCSKN